MLGTIAKGERLGYTSSCPILCSINTDYAKFKAMTIRHRDFAPLSTPNIVWCIIKMSIVQALTQVGGGHVHRCRPPRQHEAFLLAMGLYIVRNHEADDDRVMMDATLVILFFFFFFFSFLFFLRSQDSLHWIFFTPGIDMSQLVYVLSVAQATCDSSIVFGSQ